MTCVHLQQLYKLCHEHDLKLSGTDLIRVVCQQCGEQEVCPSTLMDEYDAKKLHPDADKPMSDERHAEDSATQQ
jgi:hypothetical protein